MADQSATFAIELDVKGASGANDAASALADLQAQISADTAELGKLQAALRAIQSGTNVSVAAFKRLRDAIAGKKEALASANARFVELGGTFSGITAKAGAVGENFGDLLDAAKDASGPLGGMFDGLKKIHGAVGELGATKAVAVGALAALAAVAAIVVVSFIAAAVSITQFALASADAARSSRLLLEANAGSAAAGSALADMVERVSARSAIARSKVEGFAVSLSRAGLKGLELQAALEAVAAAASAGRDDIAQKFLADAKAAAAAGKSVTDLANKIKNEFGGVAAKAALGFQNQLNKLKENLARVFAGVKIEPFLVALRGVLSLFDQSTASGKALKAIAEGMLNPLFSMLASLEPLAKGFFKGMIIGALLLTVAVLKIKQAFTSVFGDAAKDIDLLKLGVYLGIGAFGALLAIVGVVGLAMAIAFLPALIAIAAIALGVALLVAPFVAVGAAVYGLYLAFQAAWEAISSIDFASLGSNIVSSIADAIAGGAAWVVDAMTNLASSALGAFKGVFGISSPSKAMKEAGGDIAEGGIIGVEAKSAEADAALSDMMTIPAPGGTGAKSGSSGGAKTINIHLHGVQGADLESPSLWVKVVGLLEAAAESASPEPEPV
jgi:hypothetical protein